jgi:hypothetical protein
MTGRAVVRNNFIDSVVIRHSVRSRMIQVAVNVHLSSRAARPEALGFGVNRASIVSSIIIEYTRCWKRYLHLVPCYGLALFTTNSSLIANNERS